jgi:hypothetical protein
MQVSDILHLYPQEKAGPFKVYLSVPLPTGYYVQMVDMYNKYQQGPWSSHFTLKMETLRISKISATQPTDCMVLPPKNRMNICSSSYYIKFVKVILVHTDKYINVNNTLCEVIPSMPTLQQKI